MQNTTALIKSIDYYNAMSYEWAKDRAFDKAKTALDTIHVHAAGFPKKRINMGDAFYARGGQEEAMTTARL